MEIEFPIVYVIWDDAATVDSWAEATEKPVPQLVHTTGFLVNETADHIVIASTTDGTWVNGRFQIPRAMVKEMKPLKPKRKPKVKPDADPSAT